MVHCHGNQLTNILAKPIRYVNFKAQILTVTRFRKDVMPLIEVSGKVVFNGIRKHGCYRNCNICDEMSFLLRFPLSKNITFGESE